MDRAKLRLYADAIVIVLCLAAAVNAVTSHYAYRDLRSELVAAAPAAPNVATGETIPLNADGVATRVTLASPAYVTRANADRVRTLETVRLVSLIAFAALALLVFALGAVPRLIASLAPWRSR